MAEECEAKRARLSVEQDNEDGVLDDLAPGSSRSTTQNSNENDPPAIPDRLVVLQDGNEDEDAAATEPPVQDEPEASFDDLPAEVRKMVFGFMDVKALCIHREVSPEWKRECEQAIEAKKEEGAGIFQTNQSLCKATTKFYRCKHVRYDIDLAEEIARKYGWFIGTWNVSAVRDFSRVFYRMHKFNDYIGDWDVGNGTCFDRMFKRAKVFNQDISRWNMSSATDLKLMFYGCLEFNQDLSRWDVSNVKHIVSMFFEAKSFNGDISTWDTSSMTAAPFAFQKASAFNQDISKWNVSSCTHFHNMFQDAVSFNQDLSKWSVVLAEDLDSMFHGAVSFRQDLSAWNLSNVLCARGIFYGSGITPADVASWKVWKNFRRRISHFSTVKERFFDDMIGPHGDDASISDGEQAPRNVDPDPCRVS